MANAFLQRENSAASSENFFATINKGVSQRATSDFLEQATSATSNKWISATSNFCNK